MIKILFFVETLRAGGAEKVLCDLVNHMDPTQFDITVQTLWRSDAANLLSPGIQYRYCYAKQNRINRLRSRVEAALGLTYRNHIRGDYDIEVAYLECGPTKIMAGSTNKKAKKAAWVHCDLTRKMADPEGFAKKAAGWYETYDRIVCVSENVRDSFVKLFGNEDKTVVLYNTIDDAAIRQKAALPLSAEKRRLTVVTLGRLSEEKGYDRLLRIHDALIREGFRYDLWILGEGPQRQALESFIRARGLNDSVRLFGFCENPYPFIRAADLLVCSSRYEGFSTFITEGMILGKPVVTTDCTGMRELLGDSAYGLIVENEEEALLEGMRKMLGDEALRARFAARAERRGRDFRSEELSKKTQRFFTELRGEA